MILCRPNLSCLTLPLLVPRILADHHHLAVPANDLALLAHGLNRRLYLQQRSLPQCKLNQSVLRLWSYLQTRLLVLPLRFPAGARSSCAPARPLLRVTHSLAFRSQVNRPGLPRHLKRPLLESIDYAAARKIIGRQLYYNFVSREDADVVHAHLSRDVRQHPMSVIQLDPEHGVGERLYDAPLEFDYIFALGHFRDQTNLYDITSRLTVYSFFEAAKRAIRRVIPVVRPRNHLQASRSSGSVKTQGPFAVTATVCSK